VVTTESGDDPRYRAVRASGRRPPLLTAAIEDTTKGEVIGVSDAHMAFYLADLLNDLEAGKPLPPAGEQHHPVRFQLTHDASGLSRRVGVVYIHGSSARVVAAADTDDAAGTIARLLNHVDYPMIDGWPAAKPGTIVPAPGDLPEPSVPPVQAVSHRRRYVAYALVLVLPELLLFGAFALVSWQYAVIGAFVWAVLACGMWALGRALASRS